MKDPTPEAESIVELAEAVKELVRVIKCQDTLRGMPREFDNRLDALYQKASRAKNRMEAEYK